MTIFHKVVQRGVCGVVESLLMGHVLIVRGSTYGSDTRFPCSQERTGIVRPRRTRHHSDMQACTSAPTSCNLD